MMRSRNSPPLMVLPALLCAATLASAQMPDPRAMSGIPMPSADLPDGTVTVRVVRGAITNNLAGVEVELHGAGDVRKVKTGADGRAQFATLPAGTTVHAVITVDGERVTSNEFQVPARGGIRTLLAVGAGAQASTPAPPTQATPPASNSALSIGQSSRIAVEFSEDVLQVFYLLEIVNRSGTAASPTAPLVFEMPSEAQGTTVLEGSTKQAVAQGNRVVLTGPLSAGTTTLQMAYRVPSNSETLTLRQTFPLPIDMVLVAVQKVGGLRVSSPQLSRTQEAPIQSTTFIMGTGPSLQAGTPLELNLQGLPYHSRVPVWVALALVLAIVATAVWLSVRHREDPAAARQRELQQRREHGLSSLAALERERRAGRPDEQAYAARRAEIVDDLERIYSELDTSAADPAGRDAAA